MIVVHTVNCSFNARKYVVTGLFTNNDTKIMLFCDHQNQHNQKPIFDRPSRRSAKKVTVFASQRPTDK